MFLDRDERTVRRWEKQYGLPIRRLTRDRKSVVYAVESELEEWLLQPRALETEPVSPVDIPSAPAPDRAVLDQAFSDKTEPKQVLRIPAHGPVSAREVPPSRRFLIAATTVVAASLISLAALAYRATDRSAESPNRSSAEWKAAAPNPDEYVLEGELLLERRTPQSVERAVDVLTARAQRGPESAAAYAALAKALCLVREYSVVPSSKVFPLAEQAAHNALRIDPNNSDALAVLGFADFFYRWDATSAEDHFKRAIALSPTSPLPRQWFGSMLMHEGRNADALAQLSWAQQLAPSSAAIVSVRAMAMSLSGQRDAAVDILKRLELDAPEALPVHRALAYVSLQEPADIPLFLSETKRFDVLRGDISGSAEITQARKIYQTEGKVPMLRFLLASEQRRCKDEPCPTTRVAQLEAMLGEEDAAISDIATAVHAHEESALSLSIDPSFERLRQRGRLDTLLQALPSVKSADKSAH